MGHANVFTRLGSRRFHKICVVCVCVYNTIYIYESIPAEKARFECERITAQYLLEYLVRLPCAAEEGYIRKRR